MRPAVYDVAVVGGGSAGVAAAIGAARCGARTLLVERYGFLGGAATAASVLTYCGFYRAGAEPRSALGGVVEDLLCELAELGQPVAPRRSSAGNWVVDVHPETLKLAMDRLLHAAGVALRLHGVFEVADLRDGRIRAMRILGRDGAAEVEAAAFVDASGDAVLARAVGAGEAWDHPQPGSMVLRIGGVPRGAQLDRSFFGAAAEAAMRDRPRDVAALRADGGHSMRLPGSDEIWWLGLDLLTDDPTRAELIGRDLAWAFVAELRRSGGPAFAGAFLAATGPQVGVRESFHGAAREPVTGEDAAAGPLRADGVAISVWPMEVHVGLGRAVYRPVGGDGRFHVPLGALASAGADNLWLAGRTIGCDREAYGSVRVMGTAFSTGQAAGVAAATVVQWKDRHDAEAVLGRLAAQNVRL